MVPDQSVLRRHSTGNASVSAAALKSLRDAAAAAQEVKNKLGEQRRPSQGRLPSQPQPQMVSSVTRKNRQMSIIKVAQSDFNKKR